MAGPNFKAHDLLDKPFPDLFTLSAKANPDRDLVQIIQEHADAPVDAIRYTWGQTLQHAQNAAVDIRARWASRLKDAGVEQNAPSPREPGSAPIVVAILANTSGYELYINILACTLNRWTVSMLSTCGVIFRCFALAGAASLAQKQPSRDRAPACNISLSSPSRRCPQHGHRQRNGTEYILSHGHTYGHSRYAGE
jgi:hypothetical protein